jgi:hypothetical protein
MSYQRLMIHSAPRTVSQIPTNSGQQRDQKQDPVRFEIGQRDQGDHQGGDDVA